MFLNCDNRPKYVLIVFKLNFLMEIKCQIFFTMTNCEHIQILMKFLVSYSLIDSFYNV